MATNWLQQLKPLAAFSAQHSLTRRANWCRFTSKSTWLKRLECPTISPASVDGFLACFAYQRFNQKRRPFCQFFFRTLLGQEWTPIGDPMANGARLIGPAIAGLVPCRSNALTSSAVRIPSFSTGGTSSCFQASIVVWAPAKANPLRCIGFLKNIDVLTLCPSFNDDSGSALAAGGSSLAKNPWVARCRM